MIVPVPLPSPSSSAPPRTGLRSFEPGGSAGLGELRDLSAPRAGGLGSVLPPNEVRYLQLVQAVPATLAANAEALQNGYREYQELALARSGLRTIYGLTLTLTLLLSVFAAIASSVLLASSMTAPLLQLAEGTKAVAEGNFRPVREFPGNDELNLLTQSFNAMTRQLTEARDQVEHKQRELENAKTYLERVLANLSAGVVVLNNDFRLVTANHGAARILGHTLLQRTGRPLAEVDPTLAIAFEAAFADHALAASPKDSWQQQIEVKRSAAAGGEVGGGEPLMLLARGSRLPLDDGLGYVVVFDDVTQVISAQRAVAWGEVARRLAHEIKNPLTPIQLAAERLQMKLADKLPAPDSEVLRRGASTIVNQVAAMKRMVDDFRDYARVPPARLSPLDLNALIAEVGTLYGAEAGAGALHLQLAPELPADRRRCHAAAPGDPQPGRQRAGCAGGAPGSAHRRPDRARRDRRGQHPRARGAAVRGGQRTGFRREYTEACVRAVRHDEAQRDRAGTRDGEEDRRRARRPYRGRQPECRRRRRPCGRGCRDDRLPPARR